MIDLFCQMSDSKNGFAQRVRARIVKAKTIIGP